MDDIEVVPASGSTWRAAKRLIALFAGPLAALIVTLLLPASFGGDGGEVAFTLAGRATLGLMVWVVIWWVTEAVDVSATALLPLAVLPLVTFGAYESADRTVSQAASVAMREAAAPYANPFIALFLGGFVLALSMERWGLHRRIALTVLRVVGSGRMSMIAGFMGVAAVMSMWVSNTATIVMMLPVATSVIGLVDEADAAAGEHGASNFPIALLLGIAYASSVGGIGTLVGTPPNTFLAGFVAREFGREIGFAQWMMIGLPLVAVFVPVIWLMLTRVVFPVSRKPIPGGAELIREQYAALGPMRRGEWITFIVFVSTALAWMFRPQIAAFAPGITDAGIAIIAALALFAIPVDLKRGVMTMDWPTLKRLPWGILILFGGGLSLAGAINTHGVADFIGHQAVFLDGLPPVLVVIAVVAGTIAMTEMTSNTATASTLLPILSALAPVLGMSPYMLIVPAAIASSCAFMMPVATPPNAIVFGTGRVKIPQMCRAGLALHGFGIALVTALTYSVVVPLLVHGSR